MAVELLVIMQREKSFMGIPMFFTDFTFSAVMQLDSGFSGFC